MYCSSLDPSPSSALSKRATRLESVKSISQYEPHLENLHYALMALNTHSSVCTGLIASPSDRAGGSEADATLGGCGGPLFLRLLSALALNDILLMFSFSSTGFRIGTVDSSALFLRFFGGSLTHCTPAASHLLHGPPSISTSHLFLPLYTMSPQHSTSTDG